MTFIGVLALQGGVEPHVELLVRLGFDVRPVRSVEALLAASGLVLPGGESTVQRKLLEHDGLAGALDAFVASGRPLLATCAGLILAATRRYLAVDVERNAYGSQLHSRVATLDDGVHRMTFIRAPAIRALDERVEVLATLAGEPVAVRQARVLATSGHPELCGDGWLHEAAFRPAATRPVQARG
jgi:5'-phosphate synthase pdxT subunit